MAGEPRVIGLTGGIGVGKSTVAAELARLGATVVDCDGLGRIVVEPDGRAYRPLVERFGRAILRADGTVDRAELASRVFGHPEALADLNAITHPAIDVEIAEAIRAADTATVVLDMAVLVESDLGKGQYHEVLVVEAPIDVRLERLARDRGMTDEQARARIASQVDDRARRAVADHVLINDGSLEDLRAAVDVYWDEAGLR
jgi:dephospho-CoA kinase